MVSGMVRIRPVTLGSGGEGERDAGIAGRRLDQRCLARRRLALCLERFDQRNADTVLDAGNRIEEFELGQKIGDDALFLGQLVETDNGRVADRVHNGIVNAATAGFAHVIAAHEYSPNPGLCRDPILWGVT